ncbi:hypothetical protein ACIBCD_11100 [Nocardia brasiliensis]|uniref:hypothetical protein n=1 Tax=Nocardia brasiliensis TaxID=37326 RepID=UPI002455C50A|nr:hypothetical protein [Nocardia brasiliensis]
MNANKSLHPKESDVHLSVFLHGARFDFAACLTAAFSFIQDHQECHYADAVEVIPAMHPDYRACRANVYFSIRESEIPTRSNQARWMPPSSAPMCSAN